MNTTNDADESAVLLAVADWEMMCARIVPERKGRPVVGVDLGGGRAWSAAVAVYPNGRTEASSVCPRNSRYPNTREARPRSKGHVFRDSLTMGFCTFQKGSECSRSAIL